jgi:transposase
VRPPGPRQILRERARTICRRRGTRSPPRRGAALNQWDALALFLSDAHLPVDNIASENALRICALGRKNFLFVGHDAARREPRGALLAHRREVNGVNPVEYIADVLIPVQSHPASRIDELLPHNWSPPRPVPSA